jgi:tetratricopeptide (TPR) repeat protein
MSMSSNLQAADAFRQKGNYNAAFAALDRYREVSAENPDFWTVRGLLLRDLGRIGESEADLVRAFRDSPGNASYERNYAITLLHSGKWLDGWKHYQSRQYLIQWRHKRSKVKLWSGQSLKNLRVLVFQEQGAGDFIQFARFLPQLAGVGARITVQCDENLYSLVETSKGVLGVEDVITSPTAGKGDDAFDVQIPVMSLPSVLGGLAPDEADRYLVVPDSAVQTFPSLDACSRLRPLVIAWACNPGSPNAAARSCPLATFEPIVRTGEFRIQSVQLAYKRDEETKMAEFGIENLSPKLADFGQTAGALISAGNVLTIDTSVAHLAGALGVRTTLLLHTAADWRWHNDMDVSRWYGSVRIARQDRFGDWPSAIDRAYRILHE